MKAGAITAAAVLLLFAVAHLHSAASWTGDHENRSKDFAEGGVFLIAAAFILKLAGVI